VFRIFGTKMKINNLVQIELLLNHSKGFETLILKMGSYFSFENLKHKLRPKTKLASLIHNR
jgi:hypothetical protein